MAAQSMDETDACTPPGAPLPNVAQVRALGVRSVRVFCAALTQRK
jgi:hypothetical protein